MRFLLEQSLWIFQKIYKILSIKWALAELKNESDCHWTGSINCPQTHGGGTTCGLCKCPGTIFLTSLFGWKRNKQYRSDVQTTLFWLISTYHKWNSRRSPGQIDGKTNDENENRNEDAQHQLFLTSLLVVINGLLQLLSSLNSVK